MKKLLLLFVFCSSFFCFSQNITINNTKRENIKGKIIVEGHDVEGITIFNGSSNIGVITNEKGEFTIAVGQKDLLEIRALKYQKLDVAINNTILKSKKLNVFLFEETNILDEVVIPTKKLTGDLKTDVNSILTFSPKLDVIYFGIKEKYISNNKKEMENVNMHSQVETMVNGLNVVNVVDQLLIPLFRSEVKDKKTIGVPEVPVKSIKYYFGSNFLIENFNIPEHRVEEFIRYVEDETFDFNLLNYGNEIEFLELLSKKSKVFLKAKNNTD